MKELRDGYRVWVLFYVCVCVFQESLHKIVNTLALKNEEIQNFICCLKQNLQNLEVISNQLQDG